MKKKVGVLLTIIMLCVANINVYAQDSVETQTSDGINLLEQPYYILNKDGTIEESTNSKVRLTIAYPLLAPGASIVWRNVPLHAGYNFYSVKWSSATDFHIAVWANLLATTPLHQIYLKNMQAYSGSFSYGTAGTVVFVVTNDSSDYRSIVSAMYNGK